MSRLGGDVGEIETLVLTGVNMALTYAFQIVFFTGDAVLPGLAARAGRVRRRPRASCSSPACCRGASRAAARELRRRSGSISAVAEESLGNLALVQAYDRQTTRPPGTAARTRAPSPPRWSPSAWRRCSGRSAASSRSSACSLVMGFAVWELANGRVTLGGLLVFVAYLSQLYGPGRRVRRPVERDVVGQGRRRADHRGARPGARRRRPRRSGAARPRAGRARAAGRRRSPTPTPSGPRCPGSTCASPPARRSPWSGRAGRARRR